MILRKHPRWLTRLAFVAASAAITALGARTARAQIPAYLNFPTDEAGAIPTLLSATGVFTDLADLTTAPGLVRYDVNQPLWSDGAEKIRWAGIPSGSGVTFSPTGKWVFPSGSVLVKHFELGKERRRVETRFEIIKADGRAYFLTYRWRPDYSEADLVADAGLTEMLTLADGKSQSWTYPSRINCTACHNDASNPLLGPNTRQLNRAAVGSAENQLARWNSLGLFSPAIDPSAIASLDSLAHIADQSKPLELRVRSYLDTNCAVCHNPVSAPAGAAFDARFNTPLAESAIPNGPALVPLGIAGAMVIKAQDPVASLALHRLSTNKSTQRMPPLGRDLIDQEARELILRWLLTLDPITSLDVAGYHSRWLFDGSLADETGNRPGTKETAVYDDGIKGQSLALLGNGDHVDLGKFDLPGAALTISLWIWIADLDLETPFLAKAVGADEQDTFWSIGQAGAGSLSLRLKTGGVTTTLLSPGGTLQAQQWVHVGAIYDGATMRLYRDGSEVASTAKAGTLDSDPDADVAIGWQPASGDTSSYFGLIDDLRIYTRALRASELETARQAGADQNQPPSTSIDAPAGTLFVLAGQDVTLSGNASDPEDGGIANDATWYSSRDGLLGSGASIVPSPLSVGEHLVVFTANDNQRVASSDSRVITIVPGLAGYLEAYGLTGESAAALADTDSDGLAQLHEYAFHLDPNVADATPARARGAGIEFPISRQAIDLEFIVQTSTDLGSWTDGAVYRPTGDSVGRISAGGMQQVAFDDAGGATITVIERAATTSERYFRILIRQR